MSKDKLIILHNEEDYVLYINGKAYNDIDEDWANCMLWLSDATSLDVDIEYISEHRSEFPDRIDIFEEGKNAHPVEEMIVGEIKPTKQVFEFYVESKGEISDGYHTFNELYYHRMMLFLTICKANKDKAWKSWKHDDGSMFDNSFIIGIETPEGQYTYHYNKQFFDLFDVKELDFAPKYDGHKPEDITRLLSL